MKTQKHKLLNGTAEFSRLGRDLFWKFYAFNDNNEFVKVKWYGYDDDFWWYNVSITEQAQIRVGSDGRKYRIDFKTNRVSEVEE